MFHAASKNVFSSVQPLNRVRLFANPRTAADRPPCSSPTSRDHPNHVYWVGNAIQPSHLLASSSPPALNHSQHQGLCKWSSSAHQVAKILEIQLQHQFIIEYSGLISLVGSPTRVQGTIKSLQHHSSKALILWSSAFLMVKLTSIHDYWKNHSFEHMDLCCQSNVSSF